MSFAWKRALVVALALALPLALLGCGGAEEPDGAEPEAVQPEATEPDDVEPEEPEAEPTEPDEAELDEETEGAGDVSDLEGEIEGAQRIMDGFPEDVPLPAGKLLQSASEGWGDGTLYSVKISNASSVGHEDALDWYMAELERAGYTISGSKVDPGMSRAEVNATDEAGREVSARFESGDDGLRFSLTVYPPPE